MSGAVLIKTQSVGAVRGERVLFKALSLEVRSGETVLLRGANGSGKTTFLRQLAGLSEVASGAMTRVAAHHWLGHTNGLKAHETPRTHLKHWARVWGSNVEIDGVLERMQLKRPADVPCQMLSAGQKRRTALGRLLLVERPLWLLDEPFNALDTAGRDLLAGMIETHCAGGGAVIAALHGDAPLAASREVAL
ncbi:MAG: heme ABC exporter ATP-binding protein CcmA [Henriciella sp.]|nr:heme ABC exporter ATP-binding protein CcmA [Henriciella sp.]